MKQGCHKLCDSGSSKQKRQAVKAMHEGTFNGCIDSKHVKDVHAAFAAAVAVTVAYAGVVAITVAILLFCHWCITATANFMSLTIITFCI